MKCLMCKKNQARKLYCSPQCIKRAWYLRNSNSKSYFKNNPDFWKTETGKGFYWEKYVAKKLGARHIEFNNGPDLDWNGKRVDVKVCNLWQRNFKRGKPVKNQAGVWVFNRNKKKPMDYFYCICLTGKKIVKELLIPESIFGSIGISVGHKSNYDKFLI
mgnify:FL=1